MTFIATPAPGCPTCESIMIPDGNGLKCVNCGRTGTHGDPAARPMTIPSTKVPTAREAAHAQVECLGGTPVTVPGGTFGDYLHTDMCNEITAAIESRDTTLRSAVEDEARETALSWAANECDRDADEWIGNGPAIARSLARRIRRAGTGGKR